MQPCVPRVFLRPSALQKGRKALKERILFPEAGRIGDVWSMTVQGDFTDLEYTFEADGKEVPDPYGKSFGERARWRMRSIGSVFQGHYAGGRSRLTGERTGTRRFHWKIQ